MHKYEKFTVLTLELNKILGKNVITIKNGLNLTKELRINNSFFNFMVKYIIFIKSKI